MNRLRRPALVPILSFVLAGAASGQLIPDSVKQAPDVAAHRQTIQSYIDANIKVLTGEDEEKKADAFLPDQRKENAPAAEANPAPAITADAPTHYFRMMKELALLGYFTSEIGYTQAMRYVESPGRLGPRRGRLRRTRDGP